MSTDWLDVSDTTPRISYTATALQTAFTVPFVFFADADLLVYQNAVLKTLAVHYTVTGAEVEAGGTVTLLTGATAGDIITIVRDVAIEQTTHIPPSGPLDVAAMNFQTSKLIAIDQQLDNKIDRTLHFPDSDPTLSGELGSQASRANKVLAFDSTGAVIYATGPTFVGSTFVGVAVVDTRSTAAATVFTISVNVVRTEGLTASGDGGGSEYVRGIVSDPGAFQDAGGVYWKPVAYVDTGDMLDKSVTLAKLYHPTATSRLLGTNSNAALTITGAASNGGPNLIRLTVASTATFATSQKKTVSDVLGTIEANATWTITVVDATHIDLQGSVFAHTYVSGGTIGGGVDEISLGTNLTLTGTVLSAPIDALFPGYLSGLTLAAGGSSNIQIGVGAANDVAFGGMMVLASTYAKNTASWAVGSGAVGSLDTGSIAANTWYHVWLIKRPDTGVVDVLISLSATAPTIGVTVPAAYTLKRRIGSMKTDGSSNWISLTQVGDQFIWNTAITDLNASPTAGSRQILTLTVPTNIVVTALFRAQIAGITVGTETIIFTSFLEADIAGVTDLNAAVSTNAAGSFARITNTSAQIGFRAATTTATLSVGTYGWIDTRGK